MMDLESLRLKPSASANAGEKRRATKIKTAHIIDGPFICATPLAWTQKAANLPGKALHLAVAIRYLYGLHKGQAFSLSYKTAQSFGINRRAIYNGLTALEREGLIRVKRMPGRSPIIEVVSHP